jgi:hypothetical protein
LREVFIRLCLIIRIVREKKGKRLMGRHVKLFFALSPDKLLLSEVKVQQ